MLLSAPIHDPYYTLGGPLKRLPLRKAAVAFIAAVCLCLCGLLYLQLKQSRDHDLALAQVSSANLTRAMAQQAEDTFRAADLVVSSLVDWVQEAREKSVAVVINPAGLSFRSIPLLDALKTLDQPVAEVHITNIHRREALYQQSIISLAATGVICGFGIFGYEMGVRAVAHQMARAAACTMRSCEASFAAVRVLFFSFRMTGIIHKNCPAEGVNLKNEVCRSL